MAQTDRLLTRPFLLAAFANFLAGLALHGYVHLPGFLAELGAGEDLIGVIFGVMSGAAIAVRPLAGRAMDRAGRRPVMLAGGALQLLTCLLYLTVDAVGPWLFAVRTLQGVSSGLVFSALFTYAADIVPASRRTEGMGLFGISGMLPIAVGGLIGDGILAVAGYRELFATSAALALASVLASLPLSEPERADKGLGRGFFDALRQRDLLPLWFVGSSFTLALAGLFAFLKRYVDTEQVGSVGLFFGAYSAAAIVLRVALGWLPDRVGPKRALYPSLLCISAGIGGLALARSDLGMVAAAALVGLGHGFAFPILSTLVVSRANSADRGSAVSLLTAVFDAGILIGGPLLGLLAEATDFRVMYAVAATLPIGGGLVFAVWDRGR